MVYERQAVASNPTRKRSSRRAGGASRPPSLDEIATQWEHILDLADQLKRLIGHGGDAGDAPDERAPTSPGRKTFSDAVENTFLRNPELRAAAVFERIKEALGCESDAELAWIFGTSPQSLWNRKNKNSVPFREAVFVSLWAHVSLDYLLTGRGVLREDSPPDSPPA